MNYITHCQEAIAPAGSNRYYSLLFLPFELKNQLIVSYAFKEEIEAIPYKCSEPSVGMAKLQWWTEEVSNSFKGHPIHPITRAVVECSFPANSCQHFLSLIDQVKDYYYPERYDTFDLLYKNTLARSHPFSDLYSEIFALNELFKVQLVNESIALLDIVNRFLNPRLYVNKDYLFLLELVKDCNLIQPLENSDRFHESVERFHQWILESKCIEELMKESVSAYTPLKTELTYSLRTLSLLKEDDYPVLTRQYELTAIRKLWIAWRLARL